VIAVDSSVIVALLMNEPDAEVFRPIVEQEHLIIGWPTLLEIRMVLAGKGFTNAAALVSLFAKTSNVTTIAFDERHYHAAEQAFDRFGKGRHPAALNMGDCFSYAVAAIAKAPLLFKGLDFGQTDLKIYPASSA
jgi:ribonuclease VapC